ncbi:MAG: hypothetical protein R6U46_07365 [Marinilabilia sp.]
MIRPIKIFLYFIIIALLVALIDRGLGEAGISLIPGSDLFAPADQPADTAISLEISPEEEIAIKDSAVATEASGSEDTVRQEDLFVEDSLLTAPPSFRELFRTFSRKARQAGDQKSILRVLHIGDSQIEADRITSVLRRQFREAYGGAGPGLIIPYDPMRINAGVRLKNDGAWNLEYSYREKQYPGKINFGFPGKVAWFKDKEAAFTIAPRSDEPSKIGEYSNIRLLTTSPADTFQLKVSGNGGPMIDTIIPPSDALQIQDFNLSYTPGEMTFRFSGSQSPLIHGLTLDGDNGVAVDNIPMRGRPWPGIRLASEKMLKTTARQLNIGLIILQFGTNVLPTQTDDYNFYRVHYHRELQRLQTILPNVPVLVIGVQAAATVRNGKVEPLEHAALISRAQKDAALAFDMGFFDLHKAMGGENGAIQWAEDGLMLSDYMHFSSDGARKTGNKIWSALNALKTDSLRNKDSN